MKIISTILLAVNFAMPAMAADFSDLHAMNASGVTKVNPFPNPSNPDSCYLQGMNKEGLCKFKCRSGESFQIKPVKPEAASVYEKCGGGDYRNAALIKAYSSRGRYETRDNARAALSWAEQGLRSAGAEIVDSRVLADSKAGYNFAVSFRSEREMIVVPGASYKGRLTAFERMFDEAGRLEERGDYVIIGEVFPSGSGHSYVISYLVGDGPVRSVKRIKACMFKEIKKDTCVYKCIDGSTHTQPVQRPNPWDNEPVIPCPQFVFPF